VTATTSPVSFRRGLLLTSTGSIVNLVLLALETVVAARLLPVAVYGSYILLLTTVQFLMMAIDFGCKSAVTQMISATDRGQRGAIVGTTLAFRAVVLLAASALILLFRGLLAIVDPSPDLATYVGFVPIMLATASLDELLSAILQGFHEYRSMTIAQVARGILRIGLTAALLIVFRAGITGLVDSWSISFALAVVYQLWAIPMRRHLSIRWSVLVETLRFGSSLQVTRFLQFASARLHVTLLGAMAGLTSVAFFAAASRIPDALQTVSDSYFRVFFPTMTTLLAERRQEAANLLFNRSMRLISFSGALVAVIATIFSREIVLLLYTSKYASAAPVFALLMIALDMTVLVSVIGYTLTAVGRPQSSLAVTLVRTVVSGVGDLVLIPSFGVLGSAWAAVAASYASKPAGVWFVRSSHFRVDITPYLKQTIILAVCAALGWWVQLPSFAVSVAFRLFIVVAFVGLSLKLQTFSLSDLELVLGNRLSRVLPDKSSDSRTPEIAPTKATDPPLAELVEPAPVAAGGLRVPGSSLTKGSALVMPLFVTKGLSWLLLPLLTPLVSYLVLLTVAARRAPRQTRRHVPERTSRFAVLVPAHNEELAIGDTLKSLRAMDYPAALFTIYVVADNCTDQTARVARSQGATVFERVDSERRGKGYALQWLLDRLNTGGASYDAIVVLDADSVVSPNFLDVMDARLTSGERVIQAHCAVRDPDRTDAVALRSVALSAFNYLRPLGRSYLGGSAGLKGNGMVFSADVARRYRWTGSIVEDVEFHMALVLGGERVTFAPDAVVWTELPDTLSRSRTQYARWERERVSLTLRYAPRLLAAAIVRRDFVLFDAAMEWLIPPFSILVGVSLVSLIAAVVFGRWRAALLTAGLLLGEAFYVYGGTANGQVSRRWKQALLYVPNFVIWKLWLYARLALGMEGNGGWVRTIRNQE
jgi:O-antigen/teichoic acid export membrane protein/glycosyltransferase involved in cell wall biosynthesis